ncbi:hypothetical protein [Lacticaseibacillus sp. GG6-2]
MQRFYYQPAWLDFSIFWGGIVAGLGLCIIIQMEFGAYDNLYWPAVGLGVALVLVVLRQITSFKLSLSATRLTLGRFFASNRLSMPLAAVTEASATAHSITLTTKSYGKITIVRLARMAQLLTALKQANIHVATTQSLRS